MEWKCVSIPSVVNQLFNAFNRENFKLPRINSHLQKTSVPIIKYGLPIFVNFNKFS